MSEPLDPERLIEKIARGGDTPRVAMLEIADRCNEVCSHCYQTQGQKGEMSTRELKRILDELAALGVLGLTISGGEPTLRSDFLEVMQYASQLRFSITLFTNGLNVTRELAHELGKLTVREAQISLYSTQPKVHDAVTGVGGSWTRTTAAIRDLVAAGVRVRVKTPILSLNAPDYRAYMELAEELGANFSFDVAPLRPREDGSRDNDELSPSADAVREILADSRLTGSKLGIPPPKPLSARPCGACHSVHIEPNGELRPCTQLQVTCGNVRQQGTEKALRSDTVRAIKELTWQDLHGCRDCDLRRYCQRCYAVALATAGDALGPYAKACEHALRHYETVHSKAATVHGADAEEPLGPFRHIEGHQFESVPAHTTETDEELARVLGWTRRAVAPPAARTIQYGQLVQLRRPSRTASPKTASTRDVPGECQKPSRVARTPRFDSIQEIGS